MNFFNNSDYSSSDINELINQRIEESLRLDYKSARSIENSDKAKKEVSKDVSAFANSDGGIIVYGIEEENHIPQTISYIDGTIYTKEWIENIIQSNINRPIPNLEIFPIRFNDDIRKTVYIVKIPASIDSPHMCNDNRYYRRYNFKSVPMDEYEVRRAYNQKTTTDLVIESILSKKPEVYYKEITGIKITFIVIIKNVGKSTEEHCKVQVKFKDGTRNQAISIERGNNCRISNIGLDGAIIHAKNDSVIFPDEEFEIVRFDYMFPISDLSEIVEKASIVINLFYSGGTDEMILKLSSYGEEWNISLGM